MFGRADLLRCRTGLTFAASTWFITGVSMIRALPLALAAALTGTAALAAPATYTLDASHSQIVFSYNHLGYSTGYGMFSGFEGKIEFDAENPAASSVTVPSVTCQLPMEATWVGAATGACSERPVRATARAAPAA